MRNSWRNPFFCVGVGVSIGFIILCFVWICQSQETANRAIDSAVPLETALTYGGGLIRLPDRSAPIGTACFVMPVAKKGNYDVAPSRFGHTIFNLGEYWGKDKTLTVSFTGTKTTEDGQKYEVILIGRQPWP